MSGEQDQERSGSTADLESELRKGRRFTPQEAIARMAGPGAMKGGSPISPQQQAENEVGAWLKAHVSDDAGAVTNVLRRQITGSAAFHDHIERPVLAIAGFLERILSSDELLREIVREADAEWGRMMDDRPYFDKRGAPPHPDDPYTIEAVRQMLRNLSERLS